MYFNTKLADFLAGDNHPELASDFNDVTDHLISRVMGSGGSSTLDLK